MSFLPLNLGQCSMVTSKSSDDYSLTMTPHNKKYDTTTTTSITIVFYQPKKNKKIDNN